MALVYVNFTKTSKTNKDNTIYFSCLCSWLRLRQFNFPASKMAEYKIAFVILCHVPYSKYVGPLSVIEVGNTRIYNLLYMIIGFICAIRRRCMHKTENIRQPKTHNS